MGLFKKKGEDSAKQAQKKMNQPAQMALPTLPDLPKLPDLPDSEDDQDYSEDVTLPQLPSFPNSSLGDKFSQNTIKEAVAGEKEVEPEEADDMSSELPDSEDDQMMQEPLEVPTPNMTSMMPKQKSYPSYSKTYTAQKGPEPVFIRLDKFEESMDIFNEAKEQISEIEDLLRDIKEVKQKEEEELGSWENQIQEIKKQIERVDQDVFSKL